MLLVAVMGNKRNIAKFIARRQINKHHTMLSAGLMTNLNGSLGVVD
jgi:hypothetical protein